MSNCRATTGNERAAVTPGRSFGYCEWEIHREKRISRRHTDCVIEMFPIDLSESFPHLVNAPIVEAVINWQAKIERPWDAVRFRTELAEKFPEYPDPKSQELIRLKAQLKGGDLSTEVDRDQRKGFRLTSADKRHVVQFNPGGVVFSRLRPYEDWDRFSSEAKRFWSVFEELTGCIEIQRLGVRFINRVNLQVGESVEKFLRSPPGSLEPLGLYSERFLYQSTFPVLGWPYKITIGQAIEPTTTPGADRELIVDIDVFTTQPIQSPSDREPNLTRMRCLKDKAFFSLFTAEALDRFGVEIQ